MDNERISIKSILLAEDDPGDVELTLAALEENHLANKVAVVNNGEEALDYLHRRGKFKMRAGGHPIVVLFPPDRVAEETTILQRIVRGEQVEHYETVRRRKDGSRIQIRIENFM